MQDRRVRQAANLAVDVDAIIKHVLNGLGDRTATAINPMAFGFDPSSSPTSRTSRRPRSSSPTPASRTASTSASTSGPPIVEPGTLQTTEAMVADLAKAGIRAKQNYIGDNTVLVARVKDNKAAPMFDCGRGATTRSSTPTRSSSTTSSAASPGATTATRSSTT